MQIQNVTAKQLNQWIANNEAVLIDVREPAEFHTSHIQQASLVPLGIVSDDDLPNTNKKVVIYCQKGVRGNNACIKIIAQNEKRVVYNLEGGIAAWQTQGLPVIKGESNRLPLDRQVQITIGTCAFAGSAAAYFITPGFAVIPAILGASLLFTGMSGSNALALVIAKMPWNQK